MFNHLESDTQFMIAFAAKHKYTVKYDGERYGFWRVFKPSLIDGMGIQVAMCTTRYDAAKTAYALAMIKAGARLPDAVKD